MSMKRTWQRISDRIDGLSRELDGAVAETLAEQRHLDRDTVERAYWHAGYRSALIDALDLLASAEFEDHRSDIRDGSPAAVRDGARFH
ncbi:MAG: hypothetical protein NW216_11395 [Hyphomicrobium sp.]|nr:hypothetical protein [Hyphomicrobium sp.]